MDEEWVDFTEEELADAQRYSMYIAWSPEDRAYLVTVPELPGLHTHGATHEEAVVMGRDAIGAYMSALRYLGEAVPAPRLAHSVSA